MCQLISSTCPHMDGTTPNPVSCACGYSACTSATGLVCDGDSGTCSHPLACIYTDGKNANPNICRCGDGNHAYDCTPSSGMICAVDIGRNTDKCRSPCPVGHYRFNIQGYSCEPCREAGYYCPPTSGIHLSYNVNPCPAGTFSTVENLPYKNALPAGQGIAECTACPSGRFQDSPGQPACKTCIAGRSYTNTTSECTV